MIVTEQMRALGAMRGALIAYGVVAFGYFQWHTTAPGWTLVMLGAGVALFAVRKLIKFPRTVSHYGWLALARPFPLNDPESYDPDKYDSSAEIGAEYGNTFKLKTVDGIRYVFDLTSGKITETWQE